jgi:hypothetical protein
MQLMDAMLKQQAACSIGSLVVWVQQQPEQQRLDLAAVAIAARQGSAPVTCAAGGTTGPIWVAGLHLLGRFAGVAFMDIDERAGACNLAEKLTQQLDQSGKACSCNCNCKRNAQ